MSESTARHALQTPRLVLEPTTPEHAREAWPYLDDERMWEFFPDLRPKTLDDLRALYRRWERGSPFPNRNETWENWLCRSRETGLLLGATQATIVANDTAHIAYGIYVVHRRNGYAREAARATVEHLQHVHGVRRVLAEMDVRNVASVAVAESLGFRRVETRLGVRRGYGPATGEFVYELCLTRA